MVHYIMTGKIIYPPYLWSSFSGGYSWWGEINTIRNEGDNIPTGMFSLVPVVSDWIYFPNTILH